MKNVSKWASRIITTVLFIAFFLMIFTLVATKINGDVFGYQLKTVLSGSMEPVFQTGSIIAVKQTDDVNHFHKGNIVTFQTKDHGLVTHRIYKSENHGQRYVTKGDHNNAPDTEPLLADNIVATYTGFSIPYVGYAVNYIGTKAGTALLLIIPGLLMLGYSGVTIWQALREIEGNQKKVPVTEGKDT